MSDDRSPSSSAPADKPRGRKSLRVPVDEVPRRSASGEQGLAPTSDNPVRDSVETGLSPDSAEKKQREALRNPDVPPLKPPPSDLTDLRSTRPDPVRGSVRPSFKPEGDVVVRGTVTISDPPPKPTESLNPEIVIESVAPDELADIEEELDSLEGTDHAIAGEPTQVQEETSVTGRRRAGASVDEEEERLNTLELEAVRVDPDGDGARDATGDLDDLPPEREMVAEPGRRRSVEPPDDEDYGYESMPAPARARADSDRVGAQGPPTDETEIEADLSLSSDPPPSGEELDLGDLEAAELPPSEPPRARVQARRREPIGRPPPAPRDEMAEPELAPRRRSKRWFEEFFNDDYLRTVRPAEPDAVARQCDFIEYVLGLDRGATILDVGCGLGLHAVELTARGYLVVGLDLSLAMLSRAADEAQDRGVRINFLHGDMRDMTFDGAFDAVLCWGTTFGYFDDDANRQVVTRLFHALKPKGLLLLDVVNRDYVIKTQPNLVWFQGDGCVCMEETQFNYFTSRLEVKRTVILDDGRQRENFYSIRLYSLHELGIVLHHQGFRVAEVTGYEATPGVFFGADSPRVIMLAERRAVAPASALGSESQETVVLDSSIEETLTGEDELEEAEESLDSVEVETADED